jgi:hypothetical protein
MAFKFGRLRLGIQERPILGIRNGLECRVASWSVLRRCALWRVRISSSFSNWRTWTWTGSNFNPQKTKKTHLDSKYCPYFIANWKLEVMLKMLEPLKLILIYVSQIFCFWLYLVGQGLSQMGYLLIENSVS